MADITIRKVDEAVYTALKERAGADGKSLEAWLREKLAQLVAQPVVRSRYVLRAFGPGPIFAQIRRTEESIDQDSVGISKEQKKALMQAFELAKRNEAGDREEAMNVLNQQFERVLETLM
jgi:plasmid stability protein